MAYKWLAFMVVSVGTFMGTMDISGVMVALPTFGQLFGEPPEAVLWLVLSYTLTFTGLMLTAGRIADITGRRKIYTAGFIIFTVGLVLCSTAEGLWTLVAFRVLQAIGGAMLISNANAIIATAFPPDERGKALGLLESVVGAGLMAGPLVSGILLDLLGWQAIFLVRVPIGLLGILLAWSVLKDAERDTPQPEMDFGGALTLFIGLVFLMIAINQGHKIGWMSLPILGLGGSAAILLVGFFAIEARVKEPVVDLRLFQRRTFSAFSILLLAYFLPNASIPFLVPFYVVQGLGYSASIAGLMLMVIPFLMFLMSPVTGTLSDRIGSWALAGIGLALQGLGFFLVSRLSADVSSFQIVSGLGIMGFGAGIFLTPTYNAVMGATPASRLGTASALIATLRSIGQTMGQAVSGTIFAVARELHETSLASSLDGSERVSQSLIAAFQDTILMLGIIPVAGILIALIFCRPADPEREALKQEHESG